MQRPEVSGSLTLVEGRENGSRPEEEEEKREGKCLYCRNLVGGGGREMYDEINKLPNPSLRYYFVPVQSFQEIASEVEEEEGNDIDKYILTIVVPINARNARRTSGVYTGRSSRRVNTTKEPPLLPPYTFETLLSAQLWGGRTFLPPAVGSHFDIVMNKQLVCITSPKCGNTNASVNS